MCGTPTLFLQLSQLIKRSRDQLKLRVMVISGECLNRNVAKQIREVFPTSIIYNIYGLTEASPRVSYLPPDIFDKYPESAGIPLSSTKVKIVDKNGDECPVNRGCDTC